jgi:hypothetical protein
MLALWEFFWGNWPPSLPNAVIGTGAVVPFIGNAETSPNMGTVAVVVVSGAGTVSTPTGAGEIDNGL